MQFYMNRIARLIKSSKSDTGYHRWRNSTGEILRDNARVRDMLRALSNICDWASLWKRYRLITVKTVFAKKTHRVSQSSHCVGYISNLYFIYLGHHFEFEFPHFSETYVYGYPKVYLGSYQSSTIILSTIFNEVFL